MGKRRTRREKEGAHHQFTLSWQPEAKKTLFEPHVKGQLKNLPEAKTDRHEPVKNADILTKVGPVEPIKRDIIKSLILASLILGTELVIYLAWNVK